MSNDYATETEPDHPWVGELIVNEPNKPKLLRWEPADPDTGEQAYVAINHVALVGAAGGELGLQVGDRTCITTDADTIRRFWEQWEIV